MNEYLWNRFFTKGTLMNSAASFSCFRPQDLKNLGFGGHRFIRPLRCLFRPRARRRRFLDAIWLIYGARRGRGREEGLNKTQRPSKAALVKVGLRLCSEKRQRRRERWRRRRAIALRQRGAVAMVEEQRLLEGVRIVEYLA